MRTESALLLLVGLVALVGAAPYACCWNDASRLATVESLVDHGTWAIDDSIFAQGPRDGHPSPYPPGAPALTQGTLDKLLIGGRFYSDKSPVPALVLAGGYRLLRAVGLPPAAASPAWFCWILCCATMGVSLVVTVACLAGVGRAAGLRADTNLLLCVSLAFATVAWAYSRSVNNHLFLLAVTAAIWLELAWLAQGGEQVTPARSLRLGLLAGLAYTIDLGAGPPIAVLTFALVAWRCRSVVHCGTFVLAALPWVVLHHAITYAIAGTWKPANALPEYLAWPGSPHHLGNMSGVWAHADPFRLMVYALDLLLGRKGFLWHNLPLLLVLAGLPVLLRCVRARAEILVALAMCGAVWLIYSVGSSNRSGGCLSIRWFVPLLAPAYYLLAVLLAERPELRVDFLVLSVGGGVLGGMMAWVGPWTLRMVPGFWAIVGTTLLAWWVVRRRFSAGTAGGTQWRAKDNPGPGRAECPAVT